MAHEHENRLVRACLAAVARRVDVGVVVTFEEIELEYGKLDHLRLLIDGDAKCIRITAPKVMA